MNQISANKKMHDYYLDFRKCKKIPFIHLHSFFFSVSTSEEAIQIKFICIGACMYSSLKSSYLMERCQVEINRFLPKPNVHGVEYLQKKNIRDCAFEKACSPSFFVSLCHSSCIFFDFFPLRPLFSCVFFNSFFCFPFPFSCARSRCAGDAGRSTFVSIWTSHVQARFPHWAELAFCQKRTLRSRLYAARTET